MEQPPGTQIEPIYSPSNRQLDRAAKIRKFNTLYIYLPMGLASLLAVGLTILLIVLALGVGTDEVRETISGIADSFLILSIIPTMVLCAIVPTAFIALSIQMKQKDQAPIRQTQWLLWRLQSRLNILGPRIGAILAKIREPFLLIYARYAFLQSIFNSLTRFFKRG